MHRSEPSVPSCPTVLGLFGRYFKSYMISMSYFIYRHLPQAIHSLLRMEKQSFDFCNSNNSRLSSTRWRVRHRYPFQYCYIYSSASLSVPNRLVPKRTNKCSQFLTATEMCGHSVPTTVEFEIGFSSEHSMILFLPHISTCTSTIMARWYALAYSPRSGCRSIDCCLRMFLGPVLYTILTVAQDQALVLDPFAIQDQVILYC